MKLKWMLNLVNILKIGYKNRKKIIKIQNLYAPLNLIMFLYKKGIIENWYFNNNSEIICTLRYVNNKPICYNIKIMSTYGNKLYIGKKKNIKYYKDNMEIILLTSKGLMTLFEAERLKIGGQLFLIIYY